MEDLSERLREIKVSVFFHGDDDCGSGDGCLGPMCRCDDGGGPDTKQHVGDDNNAIRAVLSK